MLHWLNPAGFWALSAVLIPVAIHLWHKKQGRIVKVGSIRMVKAQESRKLHSIQLTEPWLLLLRCLIITFAALALAEPHWQAERSPRVKNEVYISPLVLQSSAAITAIRPTLDSLKQAGFLFKKLAPGFTELDLEQFGHLEEHAGITSPMRVSNSGLVSQLKSDLQRAGSVWLITSDRRQEWQHIAALIPDHWKWIPMRITADTSWLQQAWLAGPDSLLLQIGNTDAGTVSIINEIHNISDGQGMLASNVVGNIRYVKSNDSIRLYNEADQKPMLSLAIKPLSIHVVYDKEREQEITYLQSAVEAVAAYKNTWHTLTLHDTIPASLPATHVFWFRNEQVPEEFYHQRLTFFRSSLSDSTQVTNAWMKYKDKPIELQRIQGEAQGEAIWKDSFGRVLLAKQQQDASVEYQLAIPLATEWSELVYRDALPELVAQVLLEGKPQEPLFDYRVLEDEELNKLRITTESRQPTGTPVARLYDLRVWMVLLALLLWVVERWYISLRRA